MFPSNAVGKQRAKQGLAHLFGSLIKANDRDAILALSEEGVDLIHGLNSAVRNGSHSWISWFLERRVKPTPETLELAISRGQKCIDTILPYVKPEQGHVIAACVARRSELLEHLVVTLKVAIPKNAFEALVAVPRHQFQDESESELQNLKDCVAVLLRAPSVVRVPVRCFQYVIPHVTAEQVAGVVRRGVLPYPLYEQAVRCGNRPVATFLARYAPLNNATLIRASRSLGRSRQRKDIRVGADRSPSGQISRVLDECAARRIPEIHPSIALRWAQRSLDEIFRISQDMPRFANQPSMMASFRKNLDFAQQALSRTVALTHQDDREGLLQCVAHHCREVEIKARREAEKVMGGYRQEAMSQVSAGVAAMNEAVNAAGMNVAAMHAEPTEMTM